MNSFKYTIFLVNLIFFGLGSYLLYNTYQQLGGDVFNLDSALKSPIYFTLIIAGVIVLISFLGCFGTCNESPCMIKAYAGLILVCVILQVAVIVMAYKIDPEEISTGIKQKVLMKFSEQETSVKKSIQLIQLNNKCCGVDGYKDYMPVKDVEDVKYVPDSCCSKFDEHKNASLTGDCDLDSLKAVTGCKSVLQAAIKENYKYVYVVIGCVFGFQLLVIILSCALSKNIKEQYNMV